MKNSLTIVLGFLLLSAVAGAQTATPAAIDPAKEADIRHLLEVTKAVALGTQAMDSQEAVLRPLLTQSLPPGEYREKLIDLFLAKFHEKRDQTKLVDLIIPIYDKYYTREEIQQLTTLYQTPLGKKVIEIMPKIVAESAAAGQAWGQQLGRQCMQQVLDEHPEFTKALQEAKRAPQP